MRWLEERRRRSRAERLTRRVASLNDEARRQLFAEAVREGVLTQSQAVELDAAALRDKSGSLVDRNQVTVPVLSRDDAARQASSAERSVLPMAIVFVLSLATLYLATDMEPNDSMFSLRLPLLAVAPVFMLLYTILRWRERAVINRRVIELGVSVEDFGLGGRIRRHSAHKGNLLLFQFTVLGIGLITTIDVFGIAALCGLGIGGLVGDTVAVLLFFVGMILLLVTWLTFATIHFTRAVIDDIELAGATTPRSPNGGKDSGPG